MSAKLFEDFRNLTYFDVAASTIFVWDYLLTIGMEVDVVWKSKWSLMKIVFLVQRYLPFVDTIWLNLYSEVATGLNPTSCHVYALTSGILLSLGNATSQIILTLRTWAVWNRNRSLSIILPILYVVCWGSIISILITVLAGFEFAGNLPPGIYGCIAIKGSENMVIMWALILAWDAFMFGLMLVSGINAYRGSDSSELLKIVYRDGLIYYMYLLILSIANILFVAMLPTPYPKTLTSTERCLHSMLASKVLLEIRSYTSKSEWVNCESIRLDVSTRDELQNAGDVMLPDSEP